jgi:hypothetical protein
MRLVGKMQGVEVFNRHLAELDQTFDDARPTLDEVAERAFYPIMQEVFDSEGRGRWRQRGLDPEYARRKRARYGDRPILQASGALMKSLTRRHAPGNVHVTVGNDVLLVGSMLRYARRKDDEFEIFDITNRDVDRMTEVAEESLKERAGRAGFKAE